MCVQSEGVIIIMYVYMYTIHRVGMKDDTGGLQVDVSVSCIELFKHATIVSVCSFACVAKGLNRVCVDAGSGDSIQSEVWKLVHSKMEQNRQRVRPTHCTVYAYMYLHTCTYIHTYIQWTPSL